jgi:hypothetical protein
MCGFDRFHRVTVLRKTGVSYETPFRACGGCSAMFLNPSQFDANSTASPNVDNAPAQFATSSIAAPSTKQLRKNPA